MITIGTYVAKFLIGYLLMGVKLFPQQDYWPPYRHARSRNKKKNTKIVECNTLQTYFKILY